MTIPNFITLARLLAVPVVVWFVISGWFAAALILFVLAGVSDAADGFIAKRFGAASDLGAYLDPFADKTLLVSLFVSLGVDGYLPVWLTLLVVSRDFLIIGAVALSYMLANPVAIHPLWISKLNTAAQIILIALVLAREAGTDALQPVLLPMILITAALTVLSGAAYLLGWLRHMAGGGRS
ncbi:CDP-alcohol phosphatidyltransferase family protein [Propylenella binzhouense]|uniref:CDP-diacylglycerol--glycerol-3-phosphate 3-phosphatidyltransferase n=1 Tax=Propylenella binzhouense TaxID=2555902 RepID=A0A964T4V3_9HYPH|nr:CDP-alcohol phosphatidyltransferase family protein [Propylenella binzhouense]